MSYLAACPFLNKAPFSMLKVAGKSLDTIAARCPAMKRVFHTGSNVSSSLSVGKSNHFISICNMYIFVDLCWWFYYCCLHLFFFLRLLFSFLFLLRVVHNWIYFADRIFRSAHSSISTPTGKCPFRDAMQKQSMSSKPAAADPPQPTDSAAVQEEKKSAEHAACKCYTEGLQPQGERRRILVLSLRTPPPKGVCM